MTVFKINKRKKRTPNLTSEEMRAVVKEELTLSEQERKERLKQEKKTHDRMSMINTLSPQKRLKLLRYLKKQKGEQDDKK